MRSNFFSAVVATVHRGLGSVERIARILRTNSGSESAYICSALSPFFRKGRQRPCRKRHVPPRAKKKPRVRHRIGFLGNPHGVNLPFRWRTKTRMLPPSLGMTFRTKPRVSSNISRRSVSFDSSWSGIAVTTTKFSGFMKSQGNLSVSASLGADQPKQVTFGLRFVEVQNRLAQSFRACVAIGLAQRTC